MSKLLIILLAVLIILIAVGIGIYYFISYNPSAISNFASPTNEKLAPKVEKLTFLAEDDLEIVKQDYPEVIEGIIKVFNGKEIKNKLSNGVERTLYGVIITAGDKDYVVVGYDESDYNSVGIKDGQKVKVYGSFLDKSKNLLMAGAVIPE